MSELWRKRYPEEATCIRCLEVKDTMELDRLLWCDDCRSRARRRAGRWGWGVGAALAAVLALWIRFVVQPDPDLVVSGWVATVVAAMWISSKVAREIAYGVLRYRNRKAVEAVPPAAS
ncbi:MAG TPA: hypothetical protein VGA70_03660 [Longimicrobiales bacterium]